MRKLGIAAIVAASLFLTACGGDDDEATGDETTSSEETGSAEENTDDEAADDADAEEAADEGGAVDLQAALLTAEDLPEGVEIAPMDVAGMAGAMTGAADMLEGVTFEPAECQDNSADPLLADGVEAAAMTATSGDIQSGAVDFLMNAAYTNADDGFIAEIEDYYAQCGEVSVSGEMAGQQMDMTISTQVTEAPDVDADGVIALETTVAMQGLPETGTQLVYMIDGGSGTFLTVNAGSAAFDVNALATTALEKLRASQG